MDTHSQITRLLAIEREFFKLKAELLKTVDRMEGSLRPEEDLWNEGYNASIRRWVGLIRKKLLEGE